MILCCVSHAHLFSHCTVSVNSTYIYIYLPSRHQSVHQHLPSPAPCWSHQQRTELLMPPLEPISPLWYMGWSGECVGCHRWPCQRWIHDAYLVFFSMLIHRQTVIRLIHSLLKIYNNVSATLAFVLAAVELVFLPGAITKWDLHPVPGEHYIYTLGHKGTIHFVNQVWIYKPSNPSPDSSIPSPGSPCKLNLTESNGI